MKCFIHSAKEAIAACRNCGKGMCSDCSAYSGHSGVCPQCRKKEFEGRVATLSTEKKEYIWKIVGSVFLAIAIAVVAAMTVPFLFVGLLVPAIFIIVNAVRINNINADILLLWGEIDKLNKALKQGGKGI